MNQVVTETLMHGPHHFQRDREALHRLHVLHHAGRQGGEADHHQVAGQFVQLARGQMRERRYQCHPGQAAEHPAQDGPPQ
jgi:hypothetical protein